MQIERAVRAAEDKKAEALIVLDLRKAAGFTDFFVICSGGNARQIRAIADGVMEALAGRGRQAGARRGLRAFGVDSAGLLRLRRARLRATRRATSTASSGCGAMPSSVDMRAVSRRTRDTVARLPVGRDVRALVDALLSGTRCCALRRLRPDARPADAGACMPRLLGLDSSTDSAFLRCLWGSAACLARHQSRRSRRVRVAVALPRHVDRARAIGRYEGALRSIIHALKYEGRRSLAVPLAAHDARAWRRPSDRASTRSFPCRFIRHAGARAGSIRPPISRDISAFRSAPRSVVSGRRYRRRRCPRPAGTAMSEGRLWRQPPPGRFASDRPACRRCEHDGCDAGGVRTRSEGGRDRRGARAHGGTSRV